MMYPIIISFILLFTKSNAKSYRDHSLVHILPANNLELDFFRELEQFYNVTFWMKPSVVNKSIEFSISRSDYAELIRDTKDMNLEFHTVIRDLQSAFDNQTIKQYVRRKMETFDWKDYYSVEDIYNWLRDLSEMHPKEVQLQSIGKSVQDRHILAVTVKLEGANKLSNVMVEGGCHAREWISPAFVTYMINTIINAKNSADEELKATAYAHHWIFIPLLNPDGYAYTQTTYYLPTPYSITTTNTKRTIATNRLSYKIPFQDRLWRKNFHGSYGVDLNRNFGISFGKHGSSSDKQNSEYSGEAAFSEPETKALASFIRENSNNLKHYLSFHSYGQYIIIPYAFAKEHLDNYSEVKNIADKVAKRSSQKFKIYYHVGTAFDTVGYLASGTSADWVKKSIDVPYVITIELPDQGLHGFALPHDLIQPTCEATMDSIIPFLMPEYDDEDKKLRIGTRTNGKERNKCFEDLLYCYTILFILDRIY